MKRSYPTAPPSRVWVLFALDDDNEWVVDYAAPTREECEMHEANVLRDDPEARTLLKEYEVVARHPKAPEASPRSGGTAK